VLGSGLYLLVSRSKSPVAAADVELAVSQAARAPALSREAAE